MNRPTSADQHTQEGLSLASAGGDVYVATMKNGVSYTIQQEAWSVKTDYYLETFVYHLAEIIDDLKRAGNPVKKVLEIGISRGTLSIGVALLTDDDTRIVGIDIEDKSKQLVAENALANGVQDKIEVRIGNLFGPIHLGETFDLILGELPMNAIDPVDLQRYIEAGHEAEILNINGGADGRYFIDALVYQAGNYLKPGGALVFMQPSFSRVDRTLDKLAEQGFKGSILVEREWRLLDTKFTLNNKGYLETINHYTFPKNHKGEEVFFLTIVRGIKS